MEKIRQLLRANRHLTLRMLTEEVKTNKVILRKVVMEDLCKWRVCSRFVPHASTPEQKSKKGPRILICWDLIAIAGSYPDFKKNVTVNESWCFVYHLLNYINVSLPQGYQKFPPLPKAMKNAIPEVWCEDHVCDFLWLTVCNPSRICSRRSNC